VSGDDLTSTITLTSYAEEWMRSRTDLAERTVELYRWLLDRHIEPTFGSYSLEDIEPSDVRMWQCQLSPKAPDHCGQGLSPSVFNDANRNGR
jgi:hypothetical protein